MWDIDPRKAIKWDQFSIGSQDDIIETTAIARSRRKTHELRTNQSCWEMVDVGFHRISPIWFHGTSRFSFPSSGNYMRVIPNIVFSLNSP